MVCGYCNRSLGFWDRFLGRSMHPVCRGKQEAERRQAGEDLRALLERIAGDPPSASTQSQEVARLREAAGLNQDAVRLMCRQIFAAHVLAATADKDVTPEELKDLGAIIKALGLEAASVREELKDVARYAILHRVREGQLPLVTATGLLLEDEELTHWACPAELYEEKVIRRYYQGGYSGVSIPIYKGIRWSVGGFRGEPVVQTGMVATDSGRLTLTDRRVVFVGNQRSFSVPYKKILALQGYADAISVQKDGMTAKPSFFKIEDPEMIGAILSQAIAVSREAGARGRARPGPTFRIEDL
jgi:hypothetical protein